MIAAFALLMTCVTQVLAGTCCTSSTGFHTAVNAWNDNAVVATTNYGDIVGWATGLVDSMKSAFTDNGVFNSNINVWDTSSVTTFQYMFLRAALSINHSALGTPPKS